MGLAPCLDCDMAAVLLCRQDGGVMGSPDSVPAPYAALANAFGQVALGDAKLFPAITSRFLAGAFRYKETRCCDLPARLLTTSGKATR